MWASCLLFERQTDMLTAVGAAAGSGEGGEGEGERGSEWEGRRERKR